MKRIQDILSFCRIKPVMHQTEIHPKNQVWELKKFCEDNGIFLTAYYPLGGVLLMNSDNSLLKNAVIAEIAEHHKKTAAQILIRWCVQRGVVCIPKSVHTERIEENCAVFDFELTEEEMEKVRGLDLHTYYSHPKVMFSSVDTVDYFDNETH